MTKQTQTTHFGFESVEWDKKEQKVREVFHSVAQNYDLMNNLMSLGVHHLWKYFSIALSHVKAGDSVLDLAGGSGDLTRLLCRRVGSLGVVTLADINNAMLQVGRDRLINDGVLGSVNYVQANAESLPFADASFHCMTMGFGLRNVRDQMQALRSLFRVGKPGCQLMILEFSTPTNPVFKSIYDWYSFTILPKMGEWIAGDSASYQYLAESIRMHPPQERLQQMIEEAGFEDCRYYNLSGGIVALHTAYKY